MRCFIFKCASLKLPQYYYHWTSSHKLLNTIVKLDMLNMIISETAKTDNVPLVKSWKHSQQLPVIKLCILWAIKLHMTRVVASLNTVLQVLLPTEPCAHTCRTQPAGNMLLSGLCQSPCCKPNDTRITLLTDQLQWNHLVAYLERAAPFSPQNFKIFLYCFKTLRFPRRLVTVCIFCLLKTDKMHPDWSFWGQKNGYFFLAPHLPLTEIINTPLHVITQTWNW